MKMKIGEGYFSLLLGLTMVAIVSATSTTPDPSKMQEGRFLAETMRLALKRPGVADSLGQILPFLRVMPTKQRDQLAVMIRAALRESQTQAGQDDSSDYLMDQHYGEGNDLLTSAASPPNNIVSATGDDKTLREIGAEGGLPAMMGVVQSARKSNSTGVLANLLPNLDIVNLIKETVASVDTGRSMQGNDFQDRYGIPHGDLRRSGVGTRQTTSPLRKRHPPPPGNNRRHSVISTKDNGPSLNMRSPKPYEKIMRPPSQPSRRVIMGTRDKGRPPLVAFPQKTFVSDPSINESFKNNLQAQAGCSYFGPTVCLSVDYYPREAILNSIRQRKGFADALLSNDLKVGGGIPEAETAKGGEEFSVCPSEVISMARPKKAMTKSGVWKFIVNVDDMYAQTVRMEACSRPGHQCIHVAPSDGEPFLTTTCTQVRNSHRLLAWDENRGIHMDSFEIPTCCACHLTTPKSNHVSFSMSSSSSVSTSSRPSLLLNPPPTTVVTKRKRPYRGGGGGGAGVLSFPEEAEFAETNPSKRGTYLGTGPKPFHPPLVGNSATVAPPPSTTTPLLPRPLSPVAVHETWGSSSFEATRRPLPEIPYQITIAPQSSSEEAERPNSQKINYSYHPIFDFFRAGRRKESDSEDEPAVVAPSSTEAAASERSDDLNIKQVRPNERPNFGDGWSPIIRE